MDRFFLAILISLILISLILLVFASACQPAVPASEPNTANLGPSPAPAGSSTPATATFSPPPQSGGGRAGKLTLDWLATTAEFILVGKVTDIVSYRENQGNIYTKVTLSVEQTIKGETGGEVTIRVPGGEAGGLAMMVTDTPSFQLGERALVFLNKGDGFFTVAGGFQGKFTISGSNTVSDNRTLSEFMEQLENILTGQ